MEPAKLAQLVRDAAFGLGFDFVGVAPAGPSPGYRPVSKLAGGRLRWRDGLPGPSHCGARRSAHGLARSTVDHRAGCKLFQPGSAPASAGAALQDDPSRGRIAAYARGNDYHEALKPLLFELDATIRAATGRTNLGRAYVDTGPVLERSWAAEAGLGFIGKNTCLIAPRLGSWLFLGVLLVPEEVESGGWRVEGGGWRVESAEWKKGSQERNAESTDREVDNALFSLHSPPSTLHSPPCHLRRLHPLPRRLPDAGVSRAARAGRAALHQLFDHRAERADPARAASCDGQLDLRLRPMPGRLPVEPAFRPAGALGGLPAAARHGCAEVARSVSTGRRRLSTSLPQLAGSTRQAPRPAAQRLRRPGQLGRPFGCARPGRSPE